MKLAAFYHSLVSDWNHGNAHFLRGVAAELAARGHEVRIFEPADGWSLQNLVRDHGPGAIAAFHRAYPTLASERYARPLAPATLERMLDGVDAVLVHEWNAPALIAQLGRHRASGGRYALLFHDTHHRSVSAPQELERFELDHYDGVLAFGRAVRDVYQERGWARRVFVWHEAADTRRFAPRTGAPREGDVVWVGNWGDGERSAELRELLIEPIAALRLRARVYGVRYPDEALRALAAAGIAYGGWLPNFEVPDALARHAVTIHVPRRPYAEALRGIPTIRMFEALACGAPLISAPWHDDEGLFHPGEDYLVARDGAEMREHLRALLAEPARAAALAARGRQTILARHTCAHRADELLAILGELAAPPPEVPS
ncbi:MAG TPA: glycosyltransferase [Kofleriaceae bacterium]|nr:glycosyltransferase [Kofleriaceae bacterium]